MSQQPKRLLLAVIQGEGRGTVHVVEPSTPAILGRSTECEITVPDLLLSRKHCRFSIVADGAMVEDLDSKNGTFLNGGRVTVNAMKSGDLVKCGGTLLQANLDLGGGTEPNFEDEYHCSECGRPISLSTFAEDQVLEVKGTFLCPNCSGRLAQVKTHLVAGYHVVEKIGEGGMGSVYKAVQVSMDRTVALKTIRSEFSTDEKAVQRFLREARAAGTLTHPNIVTLFDAGESEGIYYIAMEYIQGRGLSDMINLEGTLAPERALAIMRQVADALDHAYKRNIVHRDIKPDNILIDEQGRVKLTDFGLAKNFQEAGLSRITAKGVGMGTLHYMPPEQVESAVEVDQRADIYALGATLYHMLAGQAPFKDVPKRDAIYAILHNKPTPVTHFNAMVSPAQEQVLDRCLAKRAEDRYQTPAELIADIDNLLAMIGPA